MKRASGLPPHARRLPGAISHTCYVFEAGCPCSFGAFVNMHAPHHRSGSPATAHAHVHFRQHLSGDPLINLTLTICFCSEDQLFPGCAFVNGNPSGFVSSITKMDFSSGYRILCHPPPPQKKKIHRPSGSIFHLLRLEAKVKAVRAD